jgi:hypothetical protein
MALQCPGTAARSAPPAGIQPLDMSFEKGTGPTDPFVVPHDGIIEFNYASVSLGSILLEVQTDMYGFVGSRVLNAHRVEGSTSATLGPGTYRLNNTGPGLASVVVSGP